jgi:ribosomal protein S18 acetylase RimI-like enzyme
MLIRSYFPSDRADLTEMMLSLNKEDSEELPLDEQKLKVFFDNLSTDEDTRVFIAEVDEQAVAYLTLSFSFSTEFGGRYAEIEEVYVKPAHRKSGVGKLLLEASENYAKSHGARSAFLVASNSNLRAQAWYEQLGYKALPRIEYLKILD